MFYNENNEKNVDMTMLVKKKIEDLVEKTVKNGKDLKDLKICQEEINTKVEIFQEKINTKLEIFQKEMIKKFDSLFDLIKKKDEGNLLI